MSLGEALPHGRNAVREGMLRYLRQVWRVGCSEPHNQLNAAFETAPGLAEALGRLVVLKQANPAAYVWASGDYYDVIARRTEAGEIGFVVCPTVEVDHEPPATCRPYNVTELLELAAAGAEVVAAEEECPTCGRRRRGRYANQSVSGRPLFLCSTCEQWSETLPTVAKPGRRSCRSGLAG
jgi:hypothetical protein